ncbi:MAG: trimethylamine methyltransferase family protein [Methanobacteriota archaeon]|nr:MAG: trimethylamine methyltransferase family protein [Euryarchaeota archaeon]
MTNEQEDLVHESSVRILQEVGIKVTSRPVLAILEEHGASVDEKSGIARIPERLVAECLSRAPKEISMCARDKKHDLRLPASYPQGVNDGQPPYMWDIEGQKKRGSTMNDLVDLTIVCDAMPEVDLYWPEVVATDIPPEVSCCHEFVASLFYTGKHVQHGSSTSEDSRLQIDTAALIVGSRKELAKRPIISITHTPMTPLRYEAGDVDAVVEFAKAGLPVVHLSMAISGSVSPVSLAGTVTLVNAENLAGIVISEISAPGAPVLYSSESGPMDMKTGVFLSGSTEGSLINAAGCQMAKRYGLPSQVGGIAASGCRPGFEVGYQKAISALIPAMAGADQVVGIGGIERSGCESLEQVVMDCELWRNVLRAWRGIDVNDATMAFDAIARVGPGGYFMKDPHTLRHFRSESLLPKIAMLPAEPGSAKEPMHLAAVREVKRVLEGHRCLELENDVKKDIRARLAEYDKRIVGGVVATDYLDR